MNRWRQATAQFRLALLLAALFLVSGRAALWAQPCPSVSLTITRTTPGGDPTGADQDDQLVGTPEVVFLQQGGVDEHTWKSQYLLNIYGADGTLVWEASGVTGDLQSGESYMDWFTGGMRQPYNPQNPLTGPIQPANGAFQVEIELQLKPWSNVDGPWSCSFFSPRVTRVLTQSEPVTTPTDPDDKLNMVCGANSPAAQTGSETDPMTGNQSWSIPVTSWPYKGNSYGLTLAYSSVGIEDPNNPDLMNFAGLSEKNSHLTHNFAMWLTLPIDETAAGWAVVHRPGHPLTFKAPTSGNFYTSLNSYDTLTASATNLSPSPSVTYPCDGAQEQATLTEPSFFTLTDRDGTSYRFSPVANGGTAPVWQIGECTAIPSRIVAAHDPDPNAFPIGLSNFPHYQDEVTTFGYDEGLSPARGNLTSITRPDDSGQHWVTQLLDDTADGVNGPPGHVTNDVGGQSAFTDDPTTGLLTSAASPENTVVSHTSPDRPASVTQITGYENHGLPTQVVDPAGRTTTTAYQAPGGGPASLNVTTSFAADGTFRLLQLDPLDRPAVAIDELGLQTAWSYNPQGQVKTVTRDAGDMDPMQRRATTAYYNDPGDVYAMDPPAGSGSRVQFDYRQYNQDGTLYTNSGAYPNGVYLGRVGRTQYADGRVECFGYNQAGELVWKRNGDGGVIQITRDVQHRVASITYPAEGAPAAFTVTRNYDEFGRPKQVTGLDGTADYVWDALNRPAHTLYPAPQDSIDFSYQPDTTHHRWTTSLNVSNLGVYSFGADSKGRPFQVTNSFAQNFSTEYNLEGTPRLRTWPSGVTEQRAYNARGFLSQIQINQPGVQNPKQFNYQYGYNDNDPTDYDGTGHIRREVDEQNQTHAFFYNNRYELVGKSDPALGSSSLTPPYAVNYGYDLNGNRTSRTQGSATDYYGVDAADRLIWVNRGVNAAPTSGQANPYTLCYWDLNDALIGRDRRDNNLVQQTLWFWHDGADHLRKVTTAEDPNAAAFFDATYNADGIRTAKDDTRGGVLTHNEFSYSPSGLLWSSNPNTVYTPGFGHRSNGVNSFYQTDWLGSTRSITDSTGSTVASQSYEAWGSRDVQAPGSPNWPTDMQFGGAWGYQSEWSNLPNEPGLGLDYLQQRYYDPVVGRFMEPDPAGFAGGLNLYQYAGDDPVNGVDPSGMQAEDEDDLIDPAEDPIGPLLRRLAEQGFQDLLRKSGITPDQFLDAEAAVDNQAFDNAVKGLPPDVLEKYPWLQPRGGVYQLEDPGTGEVCRTGCTGDLDRRSGEHRRDPKTGGLDLVVRHYTDDAAVRRGLEELLFLEFPGAPLNLIRPIAIGNPNRQTYLDAAAGFIEQTMSKGVGP